MEDNKDQSGAAVRGEAAADELKLLHRGGHSPSTSNNGIAKSWMDELDQSREYMRSASESQSGSVEPADPSKPPAGLDAREQMIWMMGRNSKECSVSARAADALSEPSELSKELREYAGNSGYSHNDYADIMRRAADALDSQPVPHQITLDAITGAIAYGRQGTNPPPAHDHWLAEYWQIGQQLAELGKTSAWDNVTPIDSRASAAPVAPGGWKLVPMEPNQDMCEQGYYEFDPDGMPDAANIWRAMIRATPAIPDAPAQAKEDAT